MNKIILKSTIFLGFIFLAFLVGNILFLVYFSRNDITKILQSRINQIDRDLRYQNEKWDTSVYINDSSIPLDDPEYIFTTGGFVIDRTNIINGFLDTSDLDYALSFNSPETIETDAGETWRVLSEPIIRHDKLEGVIILGYLNPSDKITEDLDVSLQSGALEIDSKIKMNDDSIDISQATTKNLTYDGAFEIITKFNETLRSEGGIPAYIDRSVIKRYLKGTGLQVKDGLTGRSYLVLAKPIERDGSVVGMIALGYPLDYLNLVINKQILFSIISFVVALILMFLFNVYIFRKEISDIITQTVSEKLKPKKVDIRSVGFDSSSGNILVNDEIKISIDSNTKQHDLLSLAFFKKPFKKWENDELLEAMDYRFGEGKARNVYDCVFAINKKFNSKCGFNLILHNAGVYYLDPQISNKLT
jgi:hypothetical protein